MGIGNGIGKIVTAIGRICTQGARTMQFGSQVGKMSKDGLVCFGKKINGGMQYTTLNNATGKVVRTKNIFTDANGYKYGTTWDAKGNVTSDFTHSVQRSYSGSASNNQFAGEIRNIRNEYNKLGQTTFHSDVTFKPSDQTGWLVVDSSVNRNSTKMMVNGYNRLILNG